jgi:hypothetical protein
MKALKFLHFYILIFFTVSLQLNEKGVRVYFDGSESSCVLQIY